MSGNVILGIILVCVPLFIWLGYKILKPYVMRFNTFLAFTGGAGSGKTLSAVKKALKLWRVALRQVQVHNLFVSLVRHLGFKKFGSILVEPRLYSNIPIMVSSHQFCYPLTIDILLGHKRIEPRSVVLVDEVGSVFSQWDFKNPSVIADFTDFVRLFRHYTLGGHFIVTDQSLDSIVKPLRDRLNTIYLNYHFQTFLHFFYKIDMVPLSTNEALTSMVDGDVDKYVLHNYGMFKGRLYDSYCYSERYVRVPYVGDSKPFDAYKVNSIMRLPGKTMCYIDSLQRKVSE